ncbi:MAG: VCBS repeat-containing protein, partial [Planctomycetota bacterium]
VYDCAGNLLWEKSGGSNWSPPVLADVNGDGKAEVFASYQADPGICTLKAYDGAGTELKSIDFLVDNEDLELANVVDLEGTGRHQLLCRLNSRQGNGRCGVWVFNYEAGTLAWHFEIGPRVTDIVCADFDNDHNQELVVGVAAGHLRNCLNRFDDFNAYLLCLSGAGGLRWWAAMGTWRSEAMLGNMYGGGRPCLVALRGQEYYGGTLGAYLLNPETGAETAKWIGPPGHCAGGKALGHLRRGLERQLVVGQQAAGKWAGLCILDSELNELATLRKTDEPSWVGATCDIDGDGLDEVLVLHGSSIAAYDGALKCKWSLPLGATPSPSIAVSDLGGTGQIEILVPTSAGLKVLSAGAPTLVMTATSEVRQPFFYRISANGVEPMTFEASPLPRGLRLQGAIIGGVPEAPGESDVTIRASNGLGTDVRILRITITPVVHSQTTGP